MAWGRLILWTASIQADQVAVMVEYLITVARLAATCDWNLVYGYDKEVRTRRAMDTSIPLGIHNEAFMMLVLQTNHMKKPQPKRQERFDQPLTCKDFNNGKCIRSNCRYAHKCSSCPDSATDTNHAATACPSKSKRMNYSALRA